MQVEKVTPPATVTITLSEQEARTLFEILAVLPCERHEFVSMLDDSEQRAEFMTAVSSSEYAKIANCDDDGPTLFSELLVHFTP